MPDEHVNLLAEDDDHEYLADFEPEPKMAADAFQLTSSFLASLGVDMKAVEEIAGVSPRRSSSAPSSSSSLRSAASPAARGGESDAFSAGKGAPKPTMFAVLTALADGCICVDESVAQEVVHRHGSSRPKTVAFCLQAVRERVAQANAIVFAAYEAVAARTVVSPTVTDMLNGRGASNPLSDANRRALLSLAVAEMKRCSLRFEEVLMCCRPGGNGEGGSRTLEMDPTRDNLFSAFRAAKRFGRRHGGQSDAGPAVDSFVLSMGIDRLLGALIADTQSWLLSVMH